jgi:hypothetical protein
MEKIGLKNKQMTATGLILALALAYPAMQVGKWFSNNLWTATQEAIFEQSKEITRVYGPMLPITIGAKAVYAVGTDICPGQERNTMRFLFGEKANTGMSQCIVVAPTTEKVRVTLLSDGALGPTEEWTVEREGYRTSFRRPDGSFVIANAAK